jgi:hypothetical protein
MSISAMKQALEALEKLWDIIDDIDTYGDMAKSDDKLYRSLVERRQRQRFEQTGISTDGYELNGGAITALRQAIAKEWVGLSYADIEACLPDTGVKFGDGTALFVYRLEQILKERNT